jgi:hypothetical protein
VYLVRRGRVDPHVDLRSGRIEELGGPLDPRHRDPVVLLGPGEEHRQLVERPGGGLYELILVRPHQAAAQHHQSRQRPRPLCERLAGQAPALREPAEDDPSGLDPACLDLVEQLVDARDRAG